METGPGALRDIDTPEDYCAGGRRAVYNHDSVPGGTMRWLASFALLCLFLGALLGGFILGAGLVFVLDRAASGSVGRRLAVAERDLGEARRSLESARELGRGLERGLDASRDLAQGCALEIDRAIGEAERVGDASAELSSSLERCERSLELSEASLKEARAAAARRSELELWLWRGAAFVGPARGSLRPGLRPLPIATLRPGRA